jgi:hypothetical protein
MSAKPQAARIMYRLLIPALLLAVANPANAEPRKREAFEVAVDRALERLKEHQNPDGSWNSGAGFGAGGRRDPAVSALCVMAFLSAGHVPGEGPYGATIERGVRFVLSQQQPNGVFSGHQFGMTVMYSHGICTLMVAEVVGLMPDRAEAAALREQLVRGVKLIRYAQAKSGQVRGGWRYTIQPGDADISVTGWQVMALRAAKNVGCDVPPVTIADAVEYINKSRAQGGGYKYTLNGNTTVACTAASILSLELAGKEFHGSEESKVSAQYIVNRLAPDRQVIQPNNVRGQPHFFYGVYYTAQAMFQIGGDYWKWYRTYLHWLLLHPEGHPQQASGLWGGISGDDHQAGVNYSTAMAVLALTVEYRFLPIYQRGEEPEERAK